MTERYGVIGVDEHESNMMNLFGPVRQDCAEALVEIAVKFGYQVTRENYQDVIDEAARKLGEMRKTRPVNDHRKTVEQAAEEAEKMRIAREERESAEAAKQAEVNAEASKLRQQ